MNGLGKKKEKEDIYIYIFIYKGLGSNYTWCNSK